MAAFSSAAQLRRRPAPVNTSTRRARSDTCISSEIDIGRSSKPAPNIIPFTPGAGRCSPDDAYAHPAPRVRVCDTPSGCVLATALLGLEVLSGVVRQAFGRGLIDPMVMGYDDFRRD